MRSVEIEQALYHRADYEEPKLVARSAGFADAWLNDAMQLVLGFGNRPAGTKCPHAVFAHLFTNGQAAVVQVADQILPPFAPGEEGEGQSGLAFLISAIPLKAYTRWLGDPFWLAKQLPADWQARGVMPQLTLTAAPQDRTVYDLQRVLRRMKGPPLAEDQEPERTAENSESPALLGGVQILVDGGRVVFERPNASSGVIEGLWLLLPHSTRSHLWPASFAFCNDLGFDALVAPCAFGDSYAGYADEEQAADYPESRYEHRLQRAVESGDQREVDALLSRRSVQETWKLAVGLLVLVSLAVFVTNFVRFPQREQASLERESKAALAAGTIGAGDPWTALMLLRVGDEKWRQR